ncbi:hypothetical protein LWC33_16840 [Pseudonocardia sp. RS11V-5]|uniref:hypothetical protein n=1 Tax=Pseudonocardia terrae TaxID=2905831 RepID=UPI001E63CE93|nr:hypothetical protein [Pseudonocardia terrae]MCE3553118.1 hypothetical protein [Pseudonocardia terrae]
MQDPGREDREDRDTRTDSRTATAEDDDRAREERVDELAEQMNVANNCSPPRPGDPEY